MTLSVTDSGILMASAMIGVRRVREEDPFARQNVAVLLFLQSVFGAKITPPFAPQPILDKEDTYSRGPFWLVSSKTCRKYLIQSNVQHRTTDMR